MIHFLIAAILAFAVNVAAKAQTPEPAAMATLHGHITDPSGALIPGAQISVLTSAGTAVKNVKADASGAYEVHDLPAGGYIINVTFDGFAPFQSQTIQLAAGQIKRVDVAMAIETEQQNVVVTDESPTVSVDAGNNANAVVLKGKDLDALSDDPDELSNELSALAGPSAGPNGGQIYIDGFTGGQLPPKSAIREIRINQNPFSAEYDRLGYGRIEILTKPGTDKLHGQVFMQGNDSVFNTNPLTPDVPNYDQLQYNGTISGAINKKSSFFLSVEQRDNHGQSLYNYFPVLFDPATNAYADLNGQRLRHACEPAQSHQCFAAHRSAGWQQRYGHAALPVLLRHRVGEPEQHATSLAVDLEQIDRAHRPGKRLAHHQRPHGERDAL